MSTAPLQLLAETDGDATWLLAPAVGLFTEALPTGALAAPGARAGTLLRLGRPHPVVMPPDLGGAILEACAERVHQPVGHGTRLYRLGPLDEAGASAASSAEPGAAGASGLTFPSPQTGRFWHRPSPEEPPFVEPGAALEAGTVVGMIEVMKTFATVVYAPAPGAPARARLARLLIGDGDEVEAGAPLLELEADAG